MRIYAQNKLYINVVIQIVNYGENNVFCSRNNFIMNKSQQLQLHIAKEIKRICERHKIKYFLIAGSTLGAIRHHGFIPWDDDMDIGMERNDYERFVAARKTDLGEEL